MMNQIDNWRQSPRTTVLFAVASSLFFALLFWFWERDLLWMLAVLLLPIWSPVIYQRFAERSDLIFSRRAVGFVLAGLAALLGVGVLIYLIE